MFDIGAMELLVIVIVAVIVIGPKDMPLAMRTAGRWIGKVRRVSSHFRTGVDAMVREAELEDMEKQWKARNEEIMRKHPSVPVSENAGANSDQLTGEATASRDPETAAAMNGPPAVLESESDHAAEAAPEAASVQRPDTAPHDAAKSGG
ncbi:MAG: Sec-independent protein translocase protein TatB [Pseudomonadota bacterium]